MFQISDLNTIKWKFFIIWINQNYKYTCILYAYLLRREPGSSVGIATDYGPEGPGSNPGGDEIFGPSRPVLGPTQPPIQWVPGLSRG